MLTGPFPTESEAIAACGSSSAAYENCILDCITDPPPSLTVTFTDLGVSIGVPQDSSHGYCCGVVPPGTPEFGTADTIFISLCDEQPDGDFHVGFQPITAPELGLLTLVSCNPVVLEGTFAGVGHVSISA